MARVALTYAEQIELLESAQHELGLTQAQLASLCQVHTRTFSDWRRGKYRMRYESLQRLIEQTNLSIGCEVQSIPEFTHVREAARLGAARRNRLHGNPGTPEGRRLGGITSIARRCEAAARGMAPDGFKLAKSIREPEHSPVLAEFMGIMLGDGCLSGAYQVALYFNAETDGSYADYMEVLAASLFGVAPRRSVEPGSRAGTILFSSRRLVDYLAQLGFGRGDKVVTQAGVPEWILADKDFRRRCLRGLMDTDGSVYRYQHRVYGKWYAHIALCFTNRSYPLLCFVEDTLWSLKYHPARTGYRVYLYRRSEIDRYFSDIGTCNAKHLHRYTSYSNGAERR